MITSKPVGAGKQLPQSDRLPKLTPRRRPEKESESSNPPPRTPALPAPAVLKDHKFAVPHRSILSEQDHKLFLSSAAHELVVSFVFTLSESIRNTTISDVKRSACANGPAILTLNDILGQAEDLLKQCPPLDTGSRFGNPAFRTYVDKLAQASDSWHRQLGMADDNDDDDAAIAEVSTYLRNSFGSAERIDYGSGHELNFLLWLLCLRQLRILSDDTFPALALIVFPRYLRLMREIQITYYLEPAGSHGVWGLDDYQFLPFLFGASQLLDHKHIRPLSIHNEMVVEECSKDYLYLDQVRWVNATKTVKGLRWHSPMLDDISAAKSWSKVEAGMRRMFLAEVLGKLPVAQHFLFGSLVPTSPGMGDETGAHVSHEHGDCCASHTTTVGDLKHVHSAGSWSDCCGIKVPSAIGAMQEEMKHGQSTELRRIPFD